MNKQEPDGATAPFLEENSVGATAAATEKRELFKYCLIYFAFFIVLIVIAIIVLFLCK